MADLLEWASRAGVGATAELVCDHAGARIRPGAPGATVIRLDGCVAEAPHALPYELLSRGVAHVVVRADACPGRVPEAAEHWTGLFACFAPARVSVRTEGPDADEPGAEPVEPLPAGAMPRLSRRGLLSIVTTPRTDPPAPSGTAHQRLRSAVQEVVGEDDVSRDAAGEPGVGLLLEAPDCGLAGVCAQVCPEDALTVQHAQQGSALLLDAGVCSGCGRCVEACPTRSLSVLGPAPWHSLVEGGPVVVATVATATCERCRTRFAPRDHARFCPTCAFRRANPFASVLPDEVRARLSSAPPRPPAPPR